MKALIISDKQDVIKLLTKRLESEGFDTIVYRWLIKALDNVEEIRPDFIILSVEEYPRHWKTLASFVQSGIGGNDVRFCLYNDELLTPEDKEKAGQLGVEFYSELKDFTYESEQEEIAISSDEVESSVPTVENIFTENKQVIEEIDNNFSMILTCPETEKFLFCNSVKISFDTFECDINVENFYVDQKIKYITVSNKNNLISFSGEVISLSLNKVLIRVLNYYEK